MDTMRPRDFDDIAALEQPSILAAMWRYRWLVLVIVASIAMLGLLAQEVIPAGYSAEAELFVEDPAASNPFDTAAAVARTTDTQRYVADQVEILETNAVAEEASQLLGARGFVWSPDDVTASRTITSSRDVNLITVTFDADSPEAAAAGANSIVEAYQKVRTAQVASVANNVVSQIDQLKEASELRLNEIQQEIIALQAQDAVRSELDDQFQRALEDLNRLRGELANAAEGSDRQAELRDQLADLTADFSRWEVISRIEQRDPELVALLAEQQDAIDEIANLSGQANEIFIATESNGIGLTIFSQALPPEDPSTVGTTRVLAASLILGMGVAAALAYFLASRRRAFGSRLLPELVLNAPLLAEVPNFALEGIKSPLPVTSAPTSASAESFRFAAAAVDIRAAAAGARSLMMVSATLGSGKTTTAANTAIAAAREGLKVLIIDADFGNQEVTRLLLGDVQPQYGITEVVAGHVTLDQAIQEVVVTDNRSLYVLWRGRQPVEASTFFRSEETQRFFQEVRDQFDLVLIDGPPLLQVAYASTLVRYVDGVAVIVPHNSRVGELEEVADRLHFIETPAIGYIYTKAPLRAEMTASDGSMKDILGLGFESSDKKASGRGSSNGSGGRKGPTEKSDVGADSGAGFGATPGDGPRKVRRPRQPEDRDAGMRSDEPARGRRGRNPGGGGRPDK
ncbi:MAG: AAA family ATPase [Acidimicrobiia bacterium]|nr:AAA family ATPase [Acidimicrobiia bacterium]